MSLSIYIICPSIWGSLYIDWGNDSLSTYTVSHTWFTEPAWAADILLCVSLQKCLEETVTLTMCRSRTQDGSQYNVTTIWFPMFTDSLPSPGWCHSVYAFIICWLNRAAYSSFPDSGFELIKSVDQWQIYTCCLSTWCLFQNCFSQSGHLIVNVFIHSILDRSPDAIFLMSVNNSLVEQQWKPKAFFM